MKKHIRDFIIFIILFGSLFLFIPSSNKERCLLQEDFDNKYFYGVIIRKFYDHSQHSTPLIVMKNFKNNSIDTLYFSGDQSNSFEILKESDTIYKKAKSRTIFLKKANVLKVICKVNFGCKR